MIIIKPLGYATCNEMRISKKQSETSRTLKHPLSQPRVARYKNAIGKVFPVERLPLLATFPHGAKVAIALADLADALYKLHSKTCRDVERDVAMHEPRAGVVRPERENKITASRQCSSVASDRVVCFQSGDVA
jgi:hypothetical protein